MNTKSFKITVLNYNNLPYVAAYTIRKVINRENILFMNNDNNNEFIQKLKNIKRCDQILNLNN